MINVSFAYTSPAYVARVKTCTRRDWKALHAALFRPGTEFMGYSQSPRYQGKPLHASRVISCELEPMSRMPDSDFEAEGFSHLATVPGGLDRLVANLLGAHNGLVYTDSHTELDQAWAIFRSWRERCGHLNRWTLRFEHLAEATDEQGRSGTDRDLR
jgi:hypothetical protein